MRQSSYKPLLFTTTMRSPERLRSFLEVLTGYENKILTDDLAKEIAGAIIKNGLYKPTILSAEVREKFKQLEPLTDSEVQKIMRDNPQNHKEAGFGHGWSSRFDTWFKIAKELGFVFYAQGAKIKFSSIGLNLAKSTNPQSEQAAFLHAFAKYQTNNPFRRVLNENAPLVLLLEVIKKLNNDHELNGAGISKLELPIVLYWQDNNAESLYLRIKQLRKKFSYAPSWEVILDICQNEIMKGCDIKRDNKSIMVDYPDDFIRKMRLTGLISLRGGGRFVDINKNESKKINYILKTYSNYEKYRTEERYYDYMSQVDDELICIPHTKPPVKTQEKFLTKWVETYGWETIKSEMLILQSKRSSKDDILKYLSHPIRLEFLTALAIKSRLPDVHVFPNYPIDDEGIPTSTAGGANDTGDIECREGENGILVEVTMMQGRAQTVAEVWPINRHLQKFSDKFQESMCHFIAPSIYYDSIQQINFVATANDIFIYPKTIPEFLEYLEKTHVLFVKGPSKTV